MSKAVEKFEQVPNETGIALHACPVCGDVAEVWIRSGENYLGKQIATKAVMCSNGEPVDNMENDMFSSACPMFLPHEWLYAATQREAVERWNRAALGFEKLRVANAEKCDICSRPLNTPGQPESQDCGGTCSRCMAGVGDTEALQLTDEQVRQCFEDNTGDKVAAVRAAIAADRSLMRDIN